MNVKVGDELILHSSNGKDYPVKIININEYRPPETKYAVDIYSEGTWYSDTMNDYYFCGDDLIEKCEIKKESVVTPKFYNEQIEEIEVSDTMDKKKLEIACPPLGTDSYWRIAEYRINELAKAIDRKTEYMLGHGGKDYNLIKLWAEEIIQQCAMIEYLDIDGREEG